MRRVVDDLAFADCGVGFQEVAGDDRALLAQGRLAGIEGLEDRHAVPVGVGLPDSRHALFLAGRQAGDRDGYLLGSVCQSNGHAPRAVGGRILGDAFALHAKHHAVHHRAVGVFQFDGLAGGKFLRKFLQLAHAGKRPKLECFPLAIFHVEGFALEPCVELAAGVGNGGRHPRLALVAQSLQGVLRVAPGPCDAQPIAQNAKHLLRRVRLAQLFGVDLGGNGRPLKLGFPGARHQRHALFRLGVQRQGLRFQGIFAQCFLLLEEGLVVLRDLVVDLALLVQRKYGNPARNLAGGTVALELVAFLIQRQGLAQALVQVVVAVHHGRDDLIAVVVQEIRRLVGRKRALAGGGRVGVQARHLLGEYRGRPHFRGDIGGQLRVFGRHDLPGAVHPAQHLHVGVDVQFRLRNDHVPHGQVAARLRARMRGQASRAGLIQNERVRFPVVEGAQCREAAGNALFRAGPVAQQRHVAAVVHAHRAARDLARLVAGAPDLVVDVVDGADRQLAPIAGPDLVADRVECRGR